MKILRGIHLHQGIKHVNDLLIQFHALEDCAFDESKMKTFVDVPTRNTFYIIFSLCHQTISIHEWIIICSFVSSNSDFASFSNNLQKKVFFHMSSTDKILSSGKSEKSGFNQQMQRSENEFELLFVLDVLSCQSSAANEHLLLICLQLFHLKIMRIELLRPFTFFK